MSLNSDYRDIWFFSHHLSFCTPSDSVTIVQTFRFMARLLFYFWEKSVYMYSVCLCTVTKWSKWHTNWTKRYKMNFMSVDVYVYILQCARDMFTWSYIKLLIGFIFLFFVYSWWGSFIWFDAFFTLFLFHL